MHLVRNLGLFLSCLILVPLASAHAAEPRALWADFDGDGAMDLLLTDPRHGDRFLVDRGGRLVDATAATGLAGSTATLLAQAIDLDGKTPIDLALVKEDGRLVLLELHAGQWLDVSGDEATFERAVAAAITIEGRETTLGLVATNQAAVRCADGLVDQAAAPTCLKTSTVPVAGRLYPLSTELNVSFAGGPPAPHLAFFGNGWPYQLGFAVDSAGDFDSDGTEDVLAGVPNDSATITGNGRADVYSGRDGSLLFSTSGTAYNAWRGVAAAGIGDVNGDGVADLLIGEPHAHGNLDKEGNAYVFAGGSGALLHTLTGVAFGDAFGGAVDGVADLNGDQRAELMVAAAGPGFAGFVGYVRVFSGATGTLLYHLTDNTADTGFGTAVAAVGDVNGDGKSDLAVGAPAAAGGKGRVYVYSGANAALLWTFEGDAAPDWLGFSVAAAGDVDRDGVADVIAGAPFRANGFARVFSGATGAALLTLPGSTTGDDQGRRVDGPGDLSGDGIPDLLVSAPQVFPIGVGLGVARLYSGANGSVLLTWSGQNPGDALGLGLGHAGTNLLITTANDDTGAHDGGAVRVYATQNVGIGTTTPGERLTVAGLVESEAGGLRFPDGTVQTVANTPGPKGPKGPTGPPGDQGPQGPPGGGVQSINGLANKPLSIVGAGAFSHSAAGSTITLKYGPAICTEGSRTYSKGAICYLNFTNCSSGIGWQATKKTCQADGTWQSSSSSQCFNPSPLPICGA